MGHLAGRARDGLEVAREPPREHRREARREDHGHGEEPEREEGLRPRRGVERRPRHREQQRARVGLASHREDHGAQRLVRAFEVEAGVDPRGPPHGRSPAEGPRRREGRAVVAVEGCVFGERDGLDGAARHVDGRVVEVRAVVGAIDRRLDLRARVGPQRRVELVLELPRLRGDQRDARDEHRGAERGREHAREASAEGARGHRAPSGVERVPDAAERRDALALLAELLSEVPHVHVDHVGARVERGAPHA